MKRPVLRCAPAAGTAALCGAARARARHPAPARPPNPAATSATGRHVRTGTGQPAHRLRAGVGSDADRVVRGLRGRRRGGVARGPDRLRQPRRRHDPAVPRPPPGRGRGRSHRLAARQSRRSRIRALRVGVVRRAQIYDQSLVDALRHRRRGTRAAPAMSEPYIDCIDDYDQYYAGTDITPDDDAEHQAAHRPRRRSFTAQCVDKNADDHPVRRAPTTRPATWTPSVERSARTRSATSGFSYGSELGATWATLFPDTVRAAVLDGASDPDADLLQRGLQQIAGFEGTLDDLPRRSAAPTRACTFHNDGDAEGAFDRADAQARRQADPERRRSARHHARRGAAGRRRGDVQRRALAAAVRRAGRRPAGRRSRTAGAVRQLLPAASRRHVGQLARGVHSRSSAWTAPIGRRSRRRTLRRRCSRGRAAHGCPGPPGATCARSSRPADPRVEITGAGAGPIVVCGATRRRGDAARQHAQHGRRPRRRAARRHRRRRQHTCYGRPVRRPRSSTTTSSTSRRRPRRRCCPASPTDRADRGRPSLDTSLRRSHRCPDPRPVRRDRARGRGARTQAAARPRSWSAAAIRRVPDRPRVGRAARAARSATRSGSRPTSPG